jgi:filamentous hemagglutinin family protein
VFKALSSWFGFSLCILGYFCATNHPAFAQVTSDDTVNTQVTENGNTAEITGGETRGDNLFHSFQDFSVKTGNEAFFNNADSISNIFSRVTGGNVSDIDGAIRANGSANLFLINPAGILFGENASLNIGGSFYGSSASSILFEDGEFSAADLDNPPLLTVNAPIGLGFRDEPGDIINRSSMQIGEGEPFGLKVLPGNNLAFIGGNINFETGLATASGGNIELGGLSEAGIVSINKDGSFSFPDDVTKADITLSNGADVDARGTGGGNIAVNARNLSLKAGEFGSSFIRTGIRPESTSAEAQAENVTIDVTENITLDDSRILNQVALGGVGNSGNITINTGSLKALNGGGVSASTFGQGDTGVINITATGNMAFDGENSEFSSGVFNQVNTNAIGNSGGVTISTKNLNLTNGGKVSASTSGQGDASAVKITATGDIIADGEKKTDGSSSSGIESQVNPDAVGNAEGVTISTNNLTLTKGGRVAASTLGQGNAGSVDITATGDLTFDGQNTGGFVSGIESQVNPDAVGNSGGITISTNNLTLTKGGIVATSTFGQGDAGLVTIDVDKISVDGVGSGVYSNVGAAGVGDAGGIDITTGKLALTNSGILASSTFGKGNAGNITINATDILFDDRSSAGSDVFEGAVGNGGELKITTANLSINGGRISTSTEGAGNTGKIDIDATDSITIDNGGGIGNTVFPGAVGNGSPLNITTPNLTLDKGAILASTSGEGDGGSISINSTDVTLTNGSLIDASNVILTLVSEISTGSAKGNSGSVLIKADTLSLDNGLIFAGNLPSSLPTENAVPQVSGNISLEIAKNLSLRNGSQISAQSVGNANGGNVDINANLIVAFPDGANDIKANAAQGNGGNITIDAESVFGIEERPLNRFTNDLSGAEKYSRE